MVCIPIFLPLSGENESSTAGQRLAQAAAPTSATSTAAAASAATPAAAAASATSAAAAPDALQQRPL